MHDPLEFLISSANSEDNANIKNETIRSICNEILMVLEKEELIDRKGDDLEAYAYEINNMIAEEKIRNMHILCAI